MAVGLSEGAGEEAVVAAVGFPGDVEGVAEDGDGADEDSDGDVGDHAEEGDVGDAADPGGDGDDEGEEPGEDVSQAGDEADDAVDAEADLGAGDEEGFVEEDFKPVEAFVVEEGAAFVPAGWRGGERSGFWGLHGASRRQIWCRVAVLMVQSN